MSSRRIDLVLDTSAIAAYATTVDVGETINEVRDNDAVFALPAVCLVEAAQKLPAEFLELLVANGSASVPGVDPTTWRALAAMRGLLGRFDLAAAFAVAATIASSTVSRICSTASATIIGIDSV